MQYMLVKAGIPNINQSADRNRVAGANAISTFADSRGDIPISPPA